MRVVGIGIDIVENARIKESLDRHGERFVARVFTESEVRYCRECRYPEQRFAARFAAKEAVAKAFGTGIGGHVSWLDVEVERDDRGAPSVRLHGAAAAYARDLGVDRVLLSLSHTDAYAAANAVAVGGGEP